MYCTHFLVSSGLKPYSIGFCCSSYCVAIWATYLYFSVLNDWAIPIETITKSLKRVCAQICVHFLCNFLRKPVIKSRLPRSVLRADSILVSSRGHILKVPHHHPDHIYIFVSKKSSVLRCAVHCTLSQTRSDAFLRGLPPFPDRTLPIPFSLHVVSILSLLFRPAHQLVIQIT